MMTTKTKKATNLTTRNELLGLTKRRFKTIDIPELDLTFRIQSLTEREKSEYETALLTKTGRGVSRERLTDAARRLMVLCLVDDDNNRLLEPGDVNALSQLDAIVAAKIYNECQTHCGFGEEDIEQIVKNSESVSVE